MARFCTSCGESLEADDRFCGECGAPVRTPAAVGGPSEQRRRVFGDDPPTGAPRSEPSEQWKRVFGDRGPGADVPPTAHRRSPVGAIALALGVATRFSP